MAHWATKGRIAPRADKLPIIEWFMASETKQILKVSVC